MIKWAEGGGWISYHASQPFEPKTSEEAGSGSSSPPCSCTAKDWLTICKGVGFLRSPIYQTFHINANACMRVRLLWLSSKVGIFCSTKTPPEQYKWYLLESKQLSVKIETSQSGSPPKFLGSPPKEPGSEKDKKTLSRHLSLSSEKREGHILPIDHQGGSVLFGVDASRKTTLSGPFEGFAVEWRETPLRINATTPWSNATTHAVATLRIPWLSHHIIRKRRKSQTLAKDRSAPYLRTW